MQWDEIEIEIESKSNLKSKVTWRLYRTWKRRRSRSDAMTKMKAEIERESVMKWKEKAWKTKNLLPWASIERESRDARLKVVASFKRTLSEGEEERPNTKLKICKQQK